MTSEDTGMLQHDDALVVLKVLQNMLLNPASWAFEITSYFVSFCKLLLLLGFYHGCHTAYTVLHIY